jgi:PAS domain S-box-containing protein
VEILRILLVEDSLLDAELIYANLTNGGLDCELVRVETRPDFLKALEEEPFDLILSDYSLPSFDGISALDIAQATCPEVPFIFVSATLGEELAIETLKSGATDYVIKQRLDRLVPAVNRALREAKERSDRKQAELELRNLAAELEKRVEERTAQLAKTNESLREEIAVSEAARRELQRVEESLRQSETILRSYFELPLIGIAITSPDKGWLEVNDKLCDILGYDRNELMQMTWVDVTYPEDLAADLEQFNQLSAGTTEGYSLDKRYIRKDDQVIYANISVRCVRRFDGSIDYFVALVQDITKRKQTEERLRLLESVAVNANDAILITEAEPIDKPGPRIIYVNEAFTCLTGYSQEEVLGKTPRILQGPKSDRRALNKIRAALQKWQPVVVELINYRKDGSEFWVENSIVPVANKDGWYTHWIAVQRDITERKLSEEALRLSDEVLQQMPDAVFLTDLEVNIQKWTGKAEEIFGYMAQEVLGKPIHFLLSEERKAVTITKVIRKIQETGTFFGEITCLKKDGSQVPIEVTAKTIYDHSGNPIGFLSINRDITERKRAEEQREQLIREQAARREAEEQGRKSAFLAEASTVLASSLEYETTLASVANLAVPYLADWCAVNILGEDQVIRCVAVAHWEPSKAELGWELNQRYPVDINASEGLPWVLRTGQSAIASEITEAELIASAKDAEHLQILRELGLKSYMIVPMLARGRTLGAITFVSAESGRYYSQDDLSLLEHLARRAALAVDNARLYRETQEARQIAEETAERNATLQSLTAALSEALTPVQVAEVVVNQSLAALDASAGFLALLTDNNKTLEIVRALGYQEDVLDTWSRFPITASVPLADAVQRRKPILLESPEVQAEAYPHLATLYRDSGNHAWAAIPLIVEGRVLGGLGFSFPTPQTFSEDDCAFMLALAQQSGQALERARAYAAERQARAEAEAANRTKDEFLATLSHELRTPLNAMLGWTQLLRTRKLDEAKIVRALETIDRNTKALAALIEDILDVSRIITGKLHLSTHACELVSVVASAIEAVRPAAEAKAIQIDFFLDSSVGPVWGDSNRLQQVVWNLLSNAIKFTPKGGRVEVRLERVESLADSKELKGEGLQVEGLNPPSNLQPSDSCTQIQVKDTGKGIAPDFLPYVFDRFRQENNSSTRSHGGLGLGLAIVRYLVELHGGTVQASSPGEGMGATFTVQLPHWVVRNESNPPSSVEPTVAKNVAPNSAPALEGLRVLIVDDEADARDLLTTILEHSGAQVTAAASAGEALSLVLQSRADVLVSDIAMPKVDGYALIRQVRELGAERGGDIPALALTAYARDSDRTLALEAGFQVHLPKPYDPDELVRVVARLAGCKQKSLTL